MRIKDICRRRVPRLYGFLQMRFSSYRHKRLERRVQAITARIVERYGLKILSGPFAGMAYIEDALKMGRTPMLIGCYESELHAPLAGLSKRGYRTIVDVGCAEGYYAIGLTRLFPDARIHAFDIDLQARRLCMQLAQTNGVSDRVSVHERCEVHWLGSLPAEPTLIFCDCEGCELQILQPGLIPNIWRFDLIVELHDHLKLGIREAILDRFCKTHQITIISASQRVPDAYPEISFLPPKDRELAVNEFRKARTPQWAVITTREDI